MGIARIAQAQGRRQAARGGSSRSAYGLNSYADNLHFSSPLFLSASDCAILTCLDSPHPRPPPSRRALSFRRDDSSARSGTSFFPIMPPWIPFPSPASGSAACSSCSAASGCWFPHVRSQSLTGWGLTLLLIAVFPANIYMAVAHVQVHGFPSQPVDGMGAPAPSAAFDRRGALGDTDLAWNCRKEKSLEPNHVTTPAL